MWQRRFGGDRRLIEKTVQVNGRSYTVIGIMPKDFDYPVPAELWVPLALTPAERAERAELNLEALGRLKPGVSVAQARAALGNFSKQLEQEYPKTNAGRVTTILELRKELYFYSLPLFLLLQAAAGFVLLLACANLANLMFARMIGPQRAISVRAALGAGWWRVRVRFWRPSGARARCARVFRQPGQNGFLAGTESRWTGMSWPSEFFSRWA